MEPAASVIWLHGLGADGNDFVPIVERFLQLSHYKIRFIFPHAPIRPITVNGGMKMRGWYDISDLALTSNEDVAGLQASEVLVRHLIEQEIASGTESQRIILVGFSQGGALALYTGLRFHAPLAGVMALSTYLPLANTLATERNKDNQTTPIFMAHGLFDPVVPLMAGQKSRAQLEGWGYAVDWHSYPMAHTLVPEEIKDMEQFLQSILII